MISPKDRYGPRDDSLARRRDRIFAGVIASVHQQVPRSVLGSLAGVVAIVAVYWGATGRMLLVCWVAAMLAEMALRLRQTRQFRRSRIDVDSVHGWTARWVVQAGVAGALWGAAGWLLFLPAEPLKLLVLITVVLGVAFGSLTL